MEQQELIERLLEQQTSVLEKRQKIFRAEDPILPLIIEPYPIEKLEKKETPAQEFETAFAALIKSYNQMSPEEKPETIRNVIRNTSVRDTERISELFDMFWAEGLQKDLGENHSSHRLSAPFSKGDGCCCSECPHKQELERIDEFYKEFLSSGVSANMVGSLPNGYPSFVNMTNY